ncbi:hypothetical protein OX283_007510 [Flavobacterium sp. SUN052]|uniref:hypothetical protein n=1 Tax=Flavobacterium sp. SUN052 TaxID=3002441 RepID=UPI00237ED596|nr:hypothetical protein [Flavobacterium sp. SUN052]MEC4004499.1 hypothetical protein [Flavobacterium sp. SUN052]
MKKFLILLLLVSSLGFAQNLNQYKYALIPAKFSFLKEPNMYNLNALTKMYMEKYGFETYLDNETYSVDFANNNSEKIYVDVIEKSNLFTTKLRVVLKDYQNKILFTSEEGTSNDKEYKVSYNLALRMAFDNFNVLKGHRYTKRNNYDSEIKNEIGDSTPVPMGVKFKTIQNQMGFDVVNENGTVILKLFKTTQKEVFIAEKGNQKGILMKMNNEWVFEYYSNNNLILEQVDVKF